MPIPLEGLVPIAEYGSKFEVDVAVSLLVDNGIVATASYDPAMNSVATYFASDRTFEVVVRAGDVDRALDLLREAGEDLPDAFDAPDLIDGEPEPGARSARRRTITRAVAIVGLIAVLGPVLIGLVVGLLKS